jgi:hypothetical protein
MDNIDYVSAGKNNSLFRFKTACPVHDSLLFKDSLMVYGGLCGAFFAENPENTYDYMGKFSWKDSLYVKVVR